MQITKKERRQRRAIKTRMKIRELGVARLTIHRTPQHIYAQVIDDVTGHTLAAVNWTEDDLKSLKSMDQAKRAGELLAERAKAAGVESVVFDRGGYRYHGRVKALADGARESGLKF